MLKIIVAIIVSFLIVGCVGVVPQGYKPLKEKSLVYTKYNEFKKFTVYSHKNLFGNYIKIYLLDKESFNEPLYRIKFIYRGSDWIFFNSATLINTDGEDIRFTISRTDKDTEVLSGGNVYEDSDIVLSMSERKKLLKLLNSKSVKLRLSGKYYKDYQLNKSTKQGLIEMLTFQK